ncbi:UDP-N-acetylmuramate dehydrogenase [Sphingobacteriales bacterium UPWRP_1]|nr:UDP-N-acetylenolpyruvoylglucosamine reductase [Sphingobacteriales bacterium TSM_CSM]PSJ76343.1 UDP-N-acetylmuramate dehydrogenase [Sphingobacteriales bacterium UPWRP_1]
MTAISECVSLKPYNTFGIEVQARYFAHINHIQQVQELATSKGMFTQMPKLPLGGGSNLLFTQNYNGLVLYNCLKGIAIDRESSQTVWLTVQGGEVWHELVQYCVAQNWGGLENLSLIPGSAGAAPIQNIGAYGVELKDVFVQLQAVHLASGEIHNFSNAECRFGYRNSIFKTAFKGQYFICSVTLQLKKNPQFNLQYGEVQRTLEQLGYINPTVQAVSHAICHIRNAKLPNPAELGNCGSFFKNPELETTTFEYLHRLHNTMPHYPAANGRMKIPAAWLIEQCGWKGRRIGNTGTHVNHALVLVNYGNATGAEIKQLAESIQQSVLDRFGILLEPEVNIL